jgi:pimeloyl-ACP methyl ester carboxylesterase
MTHFVLVHGGWHGSWCWSRLELTLAAGGHQSTAVQLPSDVLDAGAADYAQIIASATQPTGSVIVGHSLAGLAIPLVPGLAEVSALIYLAALLPQPGTSWREQLASSTPMAEYFYSHALPHQVKDERNRTSWEAPVARELFFHDCPDDVAQTAATRLRPQAPTPVAEVSPLREFPDTKSHYVIGRGDRAVSTKWATQAAIERLGVEPVLIGGSHSPFLSQPATLADCLVSLAASSRPRTTRKEAS